MNCTMMHGSTNINLKNILWVMDRIVLGSCPVAGFVSGTESCYHNIILVTLSRDNVSVDKMVDDKYIGI